MHPQAIWHPQSCYQTSLVLFRQRLTLSSTPVSAFIRLSSSSPWVLYINKKRVGSCLDINMSCKTFGNQLNITRFLADGDYDLITTPYEDMGISQYKFLYQQNKGSSTNAMTDGVVLFPSAFGITTGSLPSITETHEFVVPKSIPIILLIILILLINDNDYANLI